MYSVEAKQTFYLSDLAREYKYQVEKSFIDFNGHLAEFGYYYYGVDGLRKLCEDRGCTPELYEQLKPYFFELYQRHDTYTSKT